MSTTPRPDTTRLQRLVHSYRDAAALMAAVELGLFTQVARGADTEAAVARALDLSAANAERLVTACVALGLLVRDGERVRNAPDVARFLVEGEPTYAGPWMLFSKPDWTEWGRLSTHLRRRESVVLGKYAQGFTVEQARKYHEATYSIGMGAARRFVRQVDLAGRRQILDLGGGSGCYCIVAAQRYPQLRAIVLDLPPVVEVTREFIASHGLADRVSALAGDFTRDALPAGSDVVIMASNLPQYSREIVQAVITRAFAALAPGGEMHLIGEMLDAARTGPRDPALWGLAEALWGSTGLAHSVAECQAYFERAGFRDVAAHDFVPGVLTRVTGMRPA
ncbi:MAG TPA: methyltransferase [Candidatus Limnocylindria bacterium]|nr:methyltransferase [Candidatus Limnocylindria bacterium]